MPEKDGFELLEMLDEVPITAFTTAFDEYAIKSFEYNALDYLLKPINTKRFERPITKVRSQLDDQLEKEEVSSEKLTEGSQIFIKDGEKCWLVRFGKISPIEIVGNYTQVFFKHQKSKLYKSLKQVEEELPEDLFFRVNRQRPLMLVTLKCCSLVQWEIETDHAKWR